MNEILLVLLILGAAVVLLVTEWLPMEATALLVLGAVALTGLLPPTEALSGFSNPAVVTVWAVFILSGGLTKTGVANIIGRHVLRMAGRDEARIIAVIMVSAGVMSAFMNNVAVAALMLPVVMDIARQTQQPASRLLMPLAYGSLLGGLTTLIGTPPNILASNALRDGGLKPFAMFDYAPVGLVVMIGGTAFMVFLGRHLLPKRDVIKETSDQLLPAKEYDLHERMSLLRVPPPSKLVGKTLAEIRIGPALGLFVVGILRAGRMELAPEHSFRIQAEDKLLVEGRTDRLGELRGWRQLVIKESGAGVDRLVSNAIGLGETVVPDGSALCGKTLHEVGFRHRFGCNVLAIRRGERVIRTSLADRPLKPGDRLLVQGPSDKVEAIKAGSDLQRVDTESSDNLHDLYRLEERLLVLQVPDDSLLAGHKIADSRLADALGMRIIEIVRSDGDRLMPEPEETLQSGDHLLVAGTPETLETLQALQDLEVEREFRPDLGQLVSENVSLIEATLAPRSQLAGKTLRQLQFREKYGVSVLAIWRAGRAWRSNLRDMELRLGDALLLYGPREKFRALGRDPNFLVLSESVQEVPRVEKAKLAALIMGTVVLTVVLGLVPIYIAAVVGAALMVVTKCLQMEEAYQFIEWKAVFLIAGMLPLGLAMDQTGAARLIAEWVVDLTGPLGPVAVAAGLMGITFLATSVVPTAALIVLMAPITLNTAANMNLSPHALMMAVAMAASSSFTSPVSHPANVLVMGPGGYRFRDYMIVGGLLTLVTWGITLLVLPVFWPLSLP